MSSPSGSLSKSSESSAPASPSLSSSSQSSPKSSASSRARGPAPSSPRSAAASEIALSASASLGASATTELRSDSATLLLPPPLARTALSCRYSSSLSIALAMRLTVFGLQLNACARLEVTSPERYRSTRSCFWLSLSRLAAMGCNCAAINHRWNCELGLQECQLSSLSSAG